MLIALTLAVVATAFALSTRSILKRHYVPQRATWAGWLLVDIVLAYSSYRHGGLLDPTFVLGSTYLAGTALVCFLSIKYGKGGNTIFDLACFVLAAVGGIASFFYGQTGTGIVLASGALWVSAIPNLKCAWEKPGEESVILWWLFLAAAIITLLQVKTWLDWPSWLFPASDTAFVSVMLSIIYVASSRAKLTSKEVADACREVLSEEDCDELAGLLVEDALHDAYSLLIEKGVDDPEAFFKEKGLME